MVCTKTLYNAVWSGQLELTPFELPEALQRNHKKARVRKNKKIYGASIEERPSEASERTVEGHWEIDTRYVPKGVSIENYSAEQILHFADEMNALPRKILEYRTPEERFDAFLDHVYSVDKVQVA